MRLLMLSVSVLLGIGAFGLSGCGDDQLPKILQVSFPAETSDPLGPYEVAAVVTDNWKIHEVNLLKSTDLSQAFVRQKMEHLGQGHYRASFGELTPGLTVFLIVEAKDSHGNRVRFPDQGSDSIDCLMRGELCWYEFRITQSD
jgi:hypothetical protein